PRADSLLRSSLRSSLASLPSPPPSARQLPDHLSIGDWLMAHDFQYDAVLASSLRAQWQLDDILRCNQELDFSRNFMPESLARTAGLEGLSDAQRRTLNQISGHQYLCIFGIVEEFVLPFVLDHARPLLNGDDHRVRALLNFAREEAQHIHLFRLVHRRFTEAFGT